jgi:hypothetical protein
VRQLQLDQHFSCILSSLSASPSVVGEKQKKLSYKDDISIPICRKGHHISLDPDYLSKERARIQREELPYFRNLIQAAEGEAGHHSGIGNISCFSAALGDDPELEPSWTSIGQNNLAWFDAEYIPTFLDAHGQESLVHIRDPTKMSVNERWACIEHWYRVGRLQMIAWKPRIISRCLSPLPFEQCWWHPEFPGKSTRKQSTRLTLQTQFVAPALNLRHHENLMPGSKGLFWLQEQGISGYGISIDARNTTGAPHMRGPTRADRTSWNDLVADPADLPYPNEAKSTWSTLLTDCTPDMVPRTAEARVQWVLSILKSIPGVEMLEATARALVTIPVGNQLFCM